ncbi:MAG: sensor histidine kinase [Desulfovibrionaceae bacterium]
MNATAHPDLSGVKYFGRMTASVSHELKNVLAIINEDAGLIEDLCALSLKGHPLPPDRLSAVCGTIRAQVRRGDEIVARMNRFAHSPDEDVAQFDLNELVEFAVGLCSRFADMREAGIAVEPGTGSLVTAPRFPLLHLLTLCLEAALTAAGRGGIVRIGVRNEETPAVELHIGAAEWPKDALRPEAAQLAESLAAVLSGPEGSGVLRLAFPVRAELKKSTL